MIKYSVIIPAYQCADSMETVVESVIQSGLLDYEIIIIDDGSRDETGNLCRTMAGKNPLIRFQSRENRGVSSTRNEGLQMAQGEYIWFLDADDAVDAGSLTEVMEVIETYQPDAVFFGMSFDYYHKEKLYRRDTLCYPEEALFSHEELEAHFEKLYDCNMLTPLWNKFIKRSVLLNGSIQCQEKMFLLEDFVFSLDLLPCCSRVYVISKPIYRYRQPEDEGNVYRRLNRIPDLNAFMEPFEKRLKEHPVVLSKLYYMLLGQKLRKASLSEIKEIGKTLDIQRFPALTESDQKLGRELMEGKYASIYFRNIKSRIRHWIANVVKKSGLYPCKIN